MTRRARVEIPNYPDVLMKPRAAVRAAKQDELFRLLSEHYASSKPPRGAPSLSKSQLTPLVWGLLHDFVPAFRRPKHPGRKKQLLEWDRNTHEDPPDLRQLMGLSTLLKKHIGKRPKIDDLFEYLAHDHRDELPPLFRGRKTGLSLKQLYYDILSKFDDAPWVREMAKNDPDGEKLRTSLHDLGKRFRELGLTEGSFSPRIGTPTKPGRPSRQE